VKEMTYRMIFVACAVQHTDNAGGEALLSQLSPSTTDQDPSVHVAVELTGEPLSVSLSPCLSTPPHSSPLLSESEKAEILRMRNSPKLYSRMAESVCPKVFGHPEVKRGILLMLFGGVHKTTPEGISLRGDINVCIIGDPSTAKSQFLKYVHRFLSRAIYTSGSPSPLPSPLIAI
jgi:DNA replication licensing factor MCM6